MPARHRSHAHVEETAAPAEATSTATGALTVTGSFTKAVGSETLRQTDVLSRATFNPVIYGRSGTPDTDPGGDSDVKQNDAATNFGANSVMNANQNTAPLNNEKRALLEFDFTRFSGMSVFPGGTHQFTFMADHDAASGNNNLRVRFSTLASRPFTESTVTWNNQPAEGTLRVNTTVAVAEGAAAIYTITLTDQNITDFLGNWVYVRMLSEAALTATFHHVRSREDATVANRPQFKFELKR